MLFQSFKQNWTKPWRTYRREQSYAGPWECITWPGKSFPSCCYDSLQTEILFWAWFVLGLDVMWASGQFSDCFREQNGDEDVEKWHAGAVRNREHELSGKTLTQKCFRALCAHVSQCQRDIEHIGPDTKVLCRAGDMQAPENLIIWYLPQSSWHINPKSRCQPSRHWTLEVCLACHHANPACWLICLSKSLWCTLVLLLVCWAADCVLLLVSSENWPGSAAVQRTIHCWPAGNPEQSVCWFQKVLEKGIPETWPKSLPNQCWCTHGAGEEHHFSSQSLFWGRRNCSRDNVVMSGQNELASVGIHYFLCGSPDGSYLGCSDLLSKRIDSDCRYFLSKQLKQTLFTFNKRRLQMVRSSVSTAYWWSGRLIVTDWKYPISFIYWSSKVNPFIIQILNANKKGKVSHGKEK